MQVNEVNSKRGERKEANKQLVFLGHQMIRSNNHQLCLKASITFRQLMENHTSTIVNLALV